MKAKVVSEKYQITYKVETSDGWKEVVEDVAYKDAYWRAFQVAGTLRCPVGILRLTVVETPKDLPVTFSFIDGIGEETTTVISGSVHIDADHFARDAQLSRYHPVNGWVVPEYINDFENAVIY